MTDNIKKKQSSSFKDGFNRSNDELDDLLGLSPEAIEKRQQKQCDNPEPSVITEQEYTTIEDEITDSYPNEFTRDEKTTGKDEITTELRPSNKIDISPLTTTASKIHITNKKQSFSLSDIPRRSGKGITINYKLKEHEIVPVENLMMVLETQVTADALKYIITRVFEDYGSLIKEEAELRQKMLVLDIDERNKLIDYENEEVRKQRLAIMGFFIAPPITRGTNVGKFAGCTLGPEYAEMLEFLMIALQTKKQPVAYRWIMNVFIADYGSILNEKTKEIKKNQALLSGKI
ncbi:hypothetical protein [uncultured Methanomethylovorans sp.]|uniref:hypothetical protein n=1 Tax=uncultured Methanomethylovorans sp. TaxID=183759 RepID=UPI002AA6CE92|nr:hypothetical protein [uncultured Methanomethylovorans sp.]